MNQYLICAQSELDAARHNSMACDSLKRAANDTVLMLERALEAAKAEASERSTDSRIANEVVGRLRRVIHEESASLSTPLGRRHLNPDGSDDLVILADFRSLDDDDKEEGEEE